MANWDKPAFTWTPISKALINPDTYRDEFDIPSVNPQFVPEWENAFTAGGGGGGGGPVSYPI